ncbi:MAG: acyl carrier protein [Candidatus Omnitrophica bacterium]|nr:acyl carrier protein [Candidatus Omnitrophota bacterium]
MKTLKKILSEVLGVSPNKINDNTSPKNVKKWDSFHGLLLVTELENSYKVKFSMDDVISVRNVGDIKKALKKYGVKIEEA